MPVVKNERVISFDILRGWAILGNLMVHTFMLVSQIEGVAETNPENLTILGYVLMGFIVVFGHFRGLFLLMSAAIHMYIMQRKLKEGIPRIVILRQELFKGLLLWLWAMFFYVFLGQWSMSKQWVETGGAIVDWHQIYHVDQFANIAWAIMISAVLFYILTANEKLKKPIISASVFAIIGLLFIFTAPYIQQCANNFWGIDFSIEPDHISKIGEKGWWDYILRLFSNQFVARESPLLPHFAYSVVGIILGIFLSQEKINKKKFFSWGYGIAGFSLVFSIFWLFVVQGLPADPVELVDFHIHPTWFVFLSIGILLIMILTMMITIEFNRKLNIARRLKLSRISRRAGFLSLTVYSLASIQALLRVGFWGIFKLFNWPNADMFRTPFGLPAYWTFILMGIELGIWTFILWLWEKGKYIGSIDWLFAAILKAPSQIKKGNKKWLFMDPLNVKGYVIDPQPILFVTPLSKEIEIQSSSIKNLEINK